jgi:hypothetical protein
MHTDDGQKIQQKREEAGWNTELNEGGEREKERGYEGEQEAGGREGGLLSWSFFPYLVKVPGGLHRAHEIITTLHNRA